VKDKLWTRRGALISALAVATTACWPDVVAAQTGPSIIFDALGEIRTVYGQSLAEEILVGGTRAIAVTITDPKRDERDAFDQLLEDIARYNRYCRQHSHHYIQADSVADIRRAPPADDLPPGPAFCQSQSIQVMVILTIFYL